MSVSLRNCLSPVALTVGLLGHISGAEAQYLGWHGDLNKAAGIAKETGKPLFVVFRCER
jgi:hypothetical protein